MDERIVRPELAMSGATAGALGVGHRVSAAGKVKGVVTPSGLLTAAWTSESQGVSVMARHLRFP